MSGWSFSKDSPSLMLSTTMKLKGWSILFYSEAYATATEIPQAHDTSLEQLQKKKDQELLSCFDIDHQAEREYWVRKRRKMSVWLTVMPVSLWDWYYIWEWLAKIFKLGKEILYAIMCDKLMNWSNWEIKMQRPMSNTINCDKTGDVFYKLMDYTIAVIGWVNH